MKIFVSYSNERAELVASLATRLRAEEHQVFHDRTSLPQGRPYDRRIREEILACDVFVFVVSEGALSRRSYARTELALAQARFPNPTGRVLPILEADTPEELLTPYLRSVTYLRQQGDLIAEVVNCLAAWKLPVEVAVKGPRGRARPLRIATVAVAATAAAAGAWAIVKPGPRTPMCSPTARSSVQDLLRHAPTGSTPSPDDISTIVAQGPPALACVVGEIGGALETQDETGRARDVAFALLRAFEGPQPGVCEWLVEVLRDRRQIHPRHAWQTHVEAAREIADPRRGCSAADDAVAEYVRDLETLQKNGKENAFETFKEWYRPKPVPPRTAFDQLMASLNRPPSSR